MSPFLFDENRSNNEVIEKNQMSMGIYIVGVSRMAVWTFLLKFPGLQQYNTTLDNLSIKHHTWLESTFINLKNR